MIKVRATQIGIYRDKVYQAGEIFEVEDEFLADVHNPDPKIAKFGWMEKYVEPVVAPAPIVPQAAEKKGWL